MADKPSYEVIIPTTGKDGKTYWKTIGAAWQKEDGKISGEMFALPAGGGSFMLVPPRSDEEAQATTNPVE